MVLGASAPPLGLRGQWSRTPRPLLLPLAAPTPHLLHPRLPAAPVHGDRSSLPDSVLCVCARAQVCDGALPSLTYVPVPMTFTTVNS